MTAKRWILITTLILLLAIPSGSVFAADDTPPVLAPDPAELVLTGKLDGSFAATLRLTASGEGKIDGLHISSSDLADNSGDGRSRDPIPSSSVTYLPAAELGELEAGETLQVVVQVAAPAEAGSYSGTLTVRWKEPQPGQITLPIKVTARTTPVLALVYPDKIILAGENSRRALPDTRQLTLRETAGGTALTGLKSVPQFLETGDGQKSLPADNVSLELSSDQVNGGELLTADLKVDTAGVPAGDYSGKILLQYDPGQLLEVPYEVKVRDASGTALVWLIGSALLGLLIAAYREWGKPRDELVRRIERVRGTLAKDETLVKCCGKELDRLLGLAEKALAEKKYPDATTHVAAAEGILEKWNANREGWLEQITYLEGFITRLAGESIYLRDLRVKSADLLREVHAQASPWTLRDAVCALEKKLADYRFLEEQLRAIGKMRTDAPASIPDGKKEAWRQTEVTLDARMQIVPADDGSLQALQTEIETLFKEINQAISEATKGRSTRAPLIQRDVQVPPEPRRSSARTPRTPRDWWATVRLSLYTILLYVLGGVVLVLVGYATLYLKEPTFGDDGIYDYLTLLAWGLGGQTSFTAVGELLRGWGIPFGKEGE